MWYFAYGSNLNARAVAEWCRHHGHRPPPMKGGKAAVLDNYRLSFPIFSEYWGGGIADIVYDPGKYVAGALYDLSEADMRILDAKVGRKLEGDKELGIYKRIDVKVAPLGKGEPVMAITYQGVSVERYHIPPTQHYMDLVIQGAYTHGLSMMWIAYIQSFSTQAENPARPAWAIRRANSDVSRRAAKTQRRFLTTDGTDDTDGKRAPSLYPCNPCHPWSDLFMMQSFAPREAQRISLNHG
jgi:hypothetical protein